MKRKSIWLVLLVLPSFVAFGDADVSVPAFWRGDSLVARATLSASVDCRLVYPVAKLEDEPTLQGLSYSAVGWDFDPVDDGSRTVVLTALPGTLVDGVFVPDGGGEMSVMEAKTGKGTVDWQPSSVSKKVYQLKHTVRVGASTDGAACLYGYFDFTQCDSAASQVEVESAVLDEVTHKIVVAQDQDRPWQPIDFALARSGIATDAEMEAGNETATTFSFSGRGTLHYEYALGGGVLEIWSDGVKAAELTQVTAGWQPGTLSFSGSGAHEVAFLYRAAVGATAALRMVRWEEPQAAVCARARLSDVTMDLQEGVRTPKFLSDVLPFVYSSTNWIGGVVGVSAESVARVTVVKLDGTDPDVRNWTEEVPGTFRELRKAAGEGEVKWRARVGVWKATFDIFNGDNGVYQEMSIFDLRGVRTQGLVISIR